jgi:phage portal protein BeeE
MKREELKVDELKATITVSALFSCCQVLTQDLARTPIRLRRQVGDDTYEDAVDHPLWELLLNDRQH